jgi:hypothetical protein
MHCLHACAAFYSFVPALSRAENQLVGSHGSRVGRRFDEATKGRCGMSTFDRSLGCCVVSSLEERIWLDRREVACAFFPSKRVGLAGFRARLRDFAARMQLGPVPDDEAWPDRHREDRF